MDEPKPSGKTLKIFVISACVAFWPMFAFGDYIGVNPDSLGPLIFTIPAGMVTFLVCLRTEFHSGGKSSYFFTNFQKDNKPQPSQMIKMGSMGKRYFGEPIGPLTIRK